MIEMRNVSVRYQDVLALDDLSLSLPAGEVFGYIGPNGAGKSTTMKVLASLLRPTSGSASIDGLDCTREGDAIRRIVGINLILGLITAVIGSSGRLWVL